MGGKQKGNSSRTLSSDNDSTPKRPNGQGKARLLINFKDQGAAAAAAGQWLTTPSFDPVAVYKIKMKLGLEIEVLNIQLCQLCQLYNASLFFKLVDLGTPRFNFANRQLPVSKLATPNFQAVNSQFTNCQLPVLCYSSL